MAQIILDFGSGNTCQNNKDYIKKMYDELFEINSDKHEIIIKWQLFKEAGKNIPLTHECFDYAYKYGINLGYQVTSSVFDKESLDFLLQYDIPFVKIANKRDLDWLIGEVPRRISVYVSKASLSYKCNYENCMEMLCVSKYPAIPEDYIRNLDICKHVYHCGYIDPKKTPQIQLAISDHTTNFELWYRYQPYIIEWHYCLNNSVGLDAGEFARTPQQLSEVL